MPKMNLSSVIYKKKTTRQKRYPATSEGTPFSPHLRKLFQLKDGNMARRQKKLARHQVIRGFREKNDVPKAFVVSKKQNKPFDIRRNKKYVTLLKEIVALARAFKMPLQSRDFLYIKYYQRLMQNKIAPKFWRVYRLKLVMPQVLSLNKYYQQRKQWKVLFRNKIRLIRFYDQACRKWFRRKLIYEAPRVAKMLAYLKVKLAQEKRQFTFTKPHASPNQRKFQINQKFNKRFKLFKGFSRNRRFGKYRYQLKLLQKQFLIYIQTSKYFYKQVACFYKQFSFSSNYEKFFFLMHHRIIVVLHKLRYFSRYSIRVKISQKLLQTGLVIVNGKTTRNVYSCIWVNDTIAVAYQLYFFEWILYRQYWLVKKRLWTVKQKAFKGSTNYRPNLFNFGGPSQLATKPWAFSSNCFPVSVIVATLGLLWRRQLVPYVYNYLNLQLIAEILPYRVY